MPGFPDGFRQIGERLLQRPAGGSDPLNVLLGASNDAEGFLGQRDGENQLSADKDTHNACK